MGRSVKGGGGSAPAAPDPALTAKAQSDANAETARLNATLNRVDQVTPQGTLNYVNKGDQWLENEIKNYRTRFDSGAYGAGDTWAWGGGTAATPDQQRWNAQDGTWETVPGAAATPGSPQFNKAYLRQHLSANNPYKDQWEAVTTLSPEQQRLYDLTTSAQTKYGEIGNNQLEAVRSTLSQPIQQDYGAERNAALSAQMSRLRPFYADQEAALRSRLVNSGITEGSEAWNNAYRQFNQGQNDALVAADLRAGDTVGQGISQRIALRNQPLNEASVLLNGGLLANPQFVNTPQTNVAPTDVIGATNGAYQGQLQAHNANQQNNAAATGGLFGLAGTLGSAALRYGTGGLFDLAKGFGR